MQGAEFEDESDDTLNALDGALDDPATRLDLKALLGCRTAHDFKYEVQAI
jgi:hypothetical protein